MSDTPYPHRTFSFAEGCRTELLICENTGLKLVRTGKLKTFRVGRRHLVTGQAIIDCKDLLMREQRRTVPS